MRLLGKCPNCGSEDTINCNEWPEGKCGNCGIIWKDWRLTQTEKGDELIPVMIGRERSEDDGQEWGVCLNYPSVGEIPWSDMIVSVLNAALIARFSDPNIKRSEWSPRANKLRVCLATEGGVEGYYKGDFIDLRNEGVKIGLYVAPYCSQGEGIRRILNFYHIMLQYLFEAGSESVSGRYRRGEILRLPKNEKGFEPACDILAIMLTRAKGEKFGKKVAEKIKEIQNNSFSAPHLKGF